MTRRARSPAGEDDHKTARNHRKQRPPQGLVGHATRQYPGGQNKAVYNLVDAGDQDPARRRAGHQHKTGAPLGRRG
jgi:hypothetical protein